MNKTNNLRSRWSIELRIGGWFVEALFICTVTTVYTSTSNLVPLWLKKRYESSVVQICCRLDADLMLESSETEVVEGSHCLYLLNVSLSVHLAEKTAQIVGKSVCRSEADSVLESSEPDVVGRHRLFGHHQRHIWCSSGWKNGTNRQLMCLPIGSGLSDRIGPRIAEAKNRRMFWTVGNWSTSHSVLN